MKHKIVKTLNYFEVSKTMHNLYKVARQIYRVFVDYRNLNNPNNPFAGKWSTFNKLTVNILNWLSCLIIWHIFNIYIVHAQAVTGCTTIMRGGWLLTSKPLNCRYVAKYISLWRIFVGNLSKQFQPYISTW